MASIVAALIGNAVYLLRRNDFDVPPIGLAVSIVIGTCIGLTLVRLLHAVLTYKTRAKDLLVVSSCLVGLLLVYSFPLYRTVLGRVVQNLTSAGIKLPFVEVNFARSTADSPVRSAASQGNEQVASAIPRQNDPLPGLGLLEQVVTLDATGYLRRDDQYVAYFLGKDIPDPSPDSGADTIQDDAIKNAAVMLVPARTLSSCLKSYVAVFPDSQLIVVDTKPALQWFLRMHARTQQAVTSGQVKLSPGSDAEVSLTRDDLASAVEQVIKSIKSILAPRREDAAPDPDAQETMLKALRFHDRASLRKCFNDPIKLEAAAAVRSADYNFLQPYIELALADLVIAHGANDEALLIMTEWLDTWQCARGKDGGSNLARPPSCAYEPTAAAQELPPWFGFRMEFSLNALLYTFVGDSNRSYRDFLRYHSARFAQYMAERIPLSGASRLERRIDLPAEAERCGTLGDKILSTKELDGLSPQDKLVLKLRTYLLRAVLNNEDTLLRSELHFLPEVTTSLGIEDLYERAQRLTKFGYGCLDPFKENGIWLEYTQNYHITAGLVGAAVGNRLSNIASSVEGQSRAKAMIDYGRSELRIGLRRLKPCDTDGHELATLPLSKRIFSASDWEGSCTLAKQVLRDIGGAD